MQVGVDGGVIWCLIMTCGFELALGVSHVSLFQHSKTLCGFLRKVYFSWEARNLSRSLTGKASDKPDFNIIQA